MGGEGAGGKVTVDVKGAGGEVAVEGGGGVTSVTQVVFARRYDNVVDVALYEWRHDLRIRPKHPYKSA